MSINRTTVKLRMGAAHHDVTVSNDEGCATVDLAAETPKSRERVLKSIWARWQRERLAAHYAKEGSGI